MKMYAIRDNQTRQVYNLDEFLDLYDGAVIKVNHTRPYSSKRKHRILVEPSEPCYYCRDLDGVNCYQRGTLYRKGEEINSVPARYCMNCGRRIKP